MTRAATAAVLACLLLPASAGAATRKSSKPLPHTGAAVNVGVDTVTLLGTVHPHRAQTTYFFQYGPAKAYGAQTAVTEATANRKSVPIAVSVTGLAAATVYHYRLVAHNRRGTIRGADRTFKTLPQPLGITLSSTANPVPFGSGVALSGSLSGTGAAGRQVVLQQNPFPYTQGFQTVGNALVTDQNGFFSFPVLSVPVNTQFRVMLPQQPEIASAPVPVGVAMRVASKVRVKHRHRRSTARFTGTIRPARDGTQISIQRFTKGAWVDVKATIARHLASGQGSRFAKTVRIRRGGLYRVLANIPDGNYVSAAGRQLRVRR